MPVYLLIASADAVTDFDRPNSNVTVDMDKALKGDVTASGHVQWIDISSYAIKGSDAPQSSGAFPKSGAGDVTFTRASIDGISPLLMRWSGSGGAPVKKPVVAIIHIVKGNQVYQELRMSDVAVSAYMTSNNGGANRGESFSLNYHDLTVMYYRPDSEHNGWGELARSAG